MDSDDFFRSDALKTLLSGAQDGADVVVSQLLKVRYDIDYTQTPAFRRATDSTVNAALENKLGWFPVAMLIDTDLLNRNAIYFREGVYFEDTDFCIRTFLICRKCTVLTETLYYYV